MVAARSDKAERLCGRAALTGSPGAHRHAGDLVYLATSVILPRHADGTGASTVIRLIPEIACAESVGEPIEGAGER